MNTASILIKTDPNIKQAAQKTAEEMGISLTSVINRYLKHFIQTKTITFTLDETPTTYMIESLKKSEHDVKTGKIKRFTAQEALDYLDQEIKNERKRSAH